MRFYQRKFRSLSLRITDSNGYLLVDQTKIMQNLIFPSISWSKPRPKNPTLAPHWPHAALGPGAGAFDCQEPQILGQSCRAPCDSGAEFAVITCEEQGWTLQDECPTESYLLDAGIYLWDFQGLVESFLVNVLFSLPKGWTQFDKSLIRTRFLLLSSAW